MTGSVTVLASNSGWRWLRGEVKVHEGIALRACCTCAPLRPLHRLLCSACEPAAARAAPAASGARAACLLRLM